MKVLTSKYQWLYFYIYQTARNEISFCLSPTASFLWSYNLVLSSYCLSLSCLSAQAQKGAAGAICQRTEEILAVIIKALPTDNSAADSRRVLTQIERLGGRTFGRTSDSNVTPPPYDRRLYVVCKPWNNRDLTQAPVSGCDRRVASRSNPQLQT